MVSRNNRYLVTSSQNLEPSSAIVLPYAKVSIFRMGMRDFRPKALQFMVSAQIVGVNEAGKYYLKNKEVGLKHLG